MAVKKSDSKTRASQKGGAIISNKVGSYEKHPFFVKKKAAAKAFLKKAGLPAEFARKTAQ